MPSYLPPTHFIGRDEERAFLRDNVRPGRVVTLCGPGGMGKTALMRWAINDPTIKERFPDGVFIHPFYQEKLAEQALAAIARHCGLDPRPDARAAAQQALAGRKLLLVLDGAEAADDLRAVVQVRGAQCGLLITSQNRAHRWDKRLDIGTLPPEKSQDLLEFWAGGERLDAAVAVAIREMVGDLPLGLRLVGRYLDATGMSAADYVQLSEAEQMAVLDAREFPDRSVLLVLSLTRNRLIGEARDAWALLGVLALAPFDGIEIIAVLGKMAREALHQLVQFGLLARNIDGYYSVSHALVHRYAYQFLKPSKENVISLATYYAQLAEEEKAKGLEGYYKLDKVRSHLLACLVACMRVRAWQEIIYLVRTVADYLEARSILDRQVTLGLDFDIQDEQEWQQKARKEQQTALEQGIAAARQLGQRQEEGAFLSHLGAAYAALGQVKEATIYYQQALAIGLEIGDQRAVGTQIGNLGNVYYSLGEIETAVAHYQQALAISREIGDKRGEGNRLGNLGNAYAALGKMEKAVTHHHQALAIARKIGDKRGEGSILGNLGNAYAALGEMEKAVAHYQQALTIAREIGDKQGESSHIGNLGLAYADLGEMEKAVTHYQQALAIAREIGDKRGEGNRLGNLGLAYADLGEMEKAKSHYEQALTIAEAIGDRKGAGLNAWNLGLLLEGADPVQAIVLMSRLVAYEEEIGHPDAAADAERVAAIRRRLNPQDPS